MSGNYSDFEDENYGDFETTDVVLGYAMKEETHDKISHLGGGYPPPHTFKSTIPVGTG